MNKKVKILMTLTSLFVATATISCSSDNNDVNNQDIINAKWIITNPGSAYASFEFTPDGHYVVIENETPTATENSIAGKAKSSFLQKNNMLATKKMSATSSSTESNLSPIHYGTYTKNGNIITLSGFGVLTIISITAEQFTFSFTLTANGETGEYTANLSAPPISESARTKLLCRAWKIHDFTLDEDSISDENKAYYLQTYGPSWRDSVIQDELNRHLDATALFSRAGTYLVLYANENSEAGLSEWKWTDSEETAFYYSWNNWQDDWEDNIVQINKIDNTSLILQEEENIWHLIIDN